MDAPQYRAILNDYFLPAVQRNFVGNEPVRVVEDNSTVHRARIVRDWYGEHIQLERLNWPAVSADLNPIENMWSMMVQKMKPCFATNRRELQDLVMERWNELTNKPEYFRTLIESMPRRMQKVIDAEGYQIGY